ncbi:MAG: hypothetical protein HY399_04380, partial [Elusimicrobia bacterium]|nr:hypothetical protein [Elusimicrobiota bacterium]
MSLWIFRALALLGSPLLVYLQINPTPKGILVGVLVGGFIVGVEAMLRKIDLITLFAAGLGAALGIILYKPLSYLVAQVNHDTLNKYWGDYALLIQCALAFLGMSVTIAKFPELDTLDRDVLAAGKKRGQALKVLDTSAIV